MVLFFGGRAEAVGKVGDDTSVRDRRLHNNNCILLSGPALSLSLARVPRSLGPWLMSFSRLMLHYYHHYYCTSRLDTFQLPITHQICQLSSLLHQAGEVTLRYKQDNRWITLLSRHSQYYQLLLSTEGILCLG